MIRLTGGVFCGRWIQTPSSNRTRPTQSRVRQALFNSLQSEIPGASVLDLFAGSGAMGLEALSRGAQQTVFVEKDPSAFLCIQNNIKLLKVQSQTILLKKSIHLCLPELEKLGPFDLILADPPYHEEINELFANWPWKILLKPSGVLLIESEKTKALLKALLPIKQKKYANTLITSYRYFYEI